MSLASNSKPADSSARFLQRMHSLRSEVDDIRGQLARRNLVAIALRCRRAQRETRTLLESNVNVLFPEETAEARLDLQNWLDYANEHIAAALSKEHDFEIIMQRLYISTLLINHVLDFMWEAMEDLKRRQVL